MPRLSDLIPQATAYLLFTILGFSLKYLLSQDMQILSKVQAGDAIMIMPLPEHLQKDFKNQGGWLDLITSLKGKKCKTSLNTRAVTAMEDQLFLKVKDKDLFEMGRLGLNPKELNVSPDKNLNLPPCHSLREIHYGF